VAGAGNLISGNTSAGIFISNSTATGNLVQGNLIGTNALGTAALGNGANGISMAQARNCTIGGTTPGARNVISGNASNDVELTNGAQGNIGTINSRPSVTLRLEFFSSPTADSSGFGEGQTFRESASVTTDAAGNANFNLTFPSVIPAGHFVTATATDVAGNTSEFSQAVQTSQPTAVEFAGLSATAYDGGVLIDVEDLYDEFNYGHKSAVAIKDFLKYAVQNWKKVPRFAMLAADSSYDPKNYLGFGDGDLVPTKLIDTDFMETASDEWLGDFNGDGIAELALGRLPVKTASEADVIVAKLIAYDQSDPSNSMLLVADTNKEGDEDSRRTWERGQHGSQSSG
jgi:hypothetical protein